VGSRQAPTTLKDFRFGGSACQIQPFDSILVASPVNCCARLENSGSAIDYAGSTAAWTAGPASRMPCYVRGFLWCRGLQGRRNSAESGGLNASMQHQSRVPRVYAQPRGGQRTRARAPVKSCAKPGNPKNGAALARSARGYERRRIRSARLVSVGGTRRNSSCFRGASLVSPTVVGGGPAFLCLRLSLADRDLFPRIPSPRAHARAVAFLWSPGAWQEYFERPRGCGAMPHVHNLSCIAQANSAGRRVRRPHGFCVL